MSRFSPGFIFPPVASVFTGFAFVDSAQISTTAATQTFSTKNFGTANADRWLIAFLTSGTANRNWTSVTIGGVAATKLADSDNAGDTSSRPSSVWMAKVPAGTSGDVVVVMSGTNAVTLALYAVVSVNGITLQDKAEQSGTSNAMSLATTAGGLLIGVDGAGGTAAALGGDIDTVDVNGVLVSTGYRTTSAHKAVPVTGTANVTVGTLGTIGSCCVVSLKPTP